MKKVKSAKAKVYSQFLIGVAIAWFTGSSISPLLAMKLHTYDALMAIIGIAISIIFLRFAVELEKKVN